MSGFLFVAITSAALADRPFALTIVDAQTGRGVPLIEAETVHHQLFVTDSNGLIAIDDPTLANQNVFFHIRGHGYEFPKDGFGYRGVTVKVEPGGSRRIAVKRNNLAERLYRVTGAGVYQDTVRLGKAAPIKRPLLNAQVFGSDSVVNAFLDGKLYWFWGDTLRPSYPLGNFHVPCATSLLPGQGGLDPAVGVDLEYVVDAKGFAAETARLPGDGPTWIFGVTVVKDRGKDRIFAAYMKVKPPLEVYERGLCVFDTQQNRFQKITVFPKEAPIQPGGQATTVLENGKPYVVFAQPYPWTRVAATAEALADLTQYEAFSHNLRELKGDQATTELRFGWRKGVAPFSNAEAKMLTKSGRLKPCDSWIQLRDIATGKSVTAHAGSAQWNAYRNRWLLLTTEVGGTSNLGEVWLAESIALEGPWVYAVKIVTHDRYSFYNPKQHPYFDQQNGRFIFFEGTYTREFSNAPTATPFYNYNQILYRLDLADDRTVLPAPIYGAEAGGMRLSRRPAPTGVDPKSIAFFAPDRPHPQLAPASLDATSQTLRLGTKGSPATDETLFFLDPSTQRPRDATSDLTPLWEIREKSGRVVGYQAATNPPRVEGLVKVIGHVWRTPFRE